MKNEIIKKKFFDNYYNKSNDEKDNIKTHREKTLISKYGVKSMNQIEKKVKIKKIQTSLKHYGMEHPMQNTDIFNKNQKSGYKFKDYILPSGKIVKVQGYEPQALDILFEQGYKEEDLVIQQRKEMSIIWYFTEDGKKHRYYPDIYIISENKIIEVKSDYTMNKYKEINILKQKASIDEGYNFEFKIL